MSNFTCYPLTCRYVAELVKLYETFARALLPPSATLQSLNLFDVSKTLTGTFSRTMSPSLSTHSGNSPTSPTSSFDHVLPIAAQYTSSSPAASNARMNAYNTLTSGRPSEGPGRNISGSTSSSDQSSSAARSHMSLPASRRDGSGGSLPHTFRASSALGSKASTRDSRFASGSSMSSFAANVPLPEDFEKVLTVITGGILQGHVKLAAALRKRYEDQYPLVRSLADVFTSHVST